MGARAIRRHGRKPYLHIPLYAGRAGQSDKQTGRRENRTGPVTTRFKKPQN